MNGPFALVRSAADRAVLILTVGFLSGFSPGTYALNASVHVAEYKHMSWRGLSSDTVSTLFEDREGSIWVPSTASIGSQPRCLDS